MTPEEGRICLEWLPPADGRARPAVEVGGYRVYRRLLPEEEYEAPLNAKPVHGNGLRGRGRSLRRQLVYTVRAMLPNKPKVEGAAGRRGAVDYRGRLPASAAPRAWTRFPRRVWCGWSGIR